MDQSHFEASQCAQVLGSNRDGERAAGAQTISGRDPEGRPVRGKYKTRRNQKIIKNLVKKGLVIMRFYDDS